MFVIITFNFDIMKKSAFIFVLISFVLYSCNNNPNVSEKIKDNHKIKTCKFQLGWIPDAHQTGFWVAKAKGFYKELGLNIIIIPGGMDASPSRSVATGVADFGQISGVEQLLTAREEQLPLELIAAIHRKSPHAIISLASKIKTPANLKGKRIAVAFGDAAEIHFKNLIKKYNISETSVDLVPFRFSLQPLIDKQVDGVTGFSTDQPFILQSQGLNPAILAYKDFGINRYGYCLIVNEKFDISNEIVTKFIEGSRKGWEFAFNNMKEAIEIMRQASNSTSLDQQIEMNKLNAIKSLMLDSNGRLLSWTIDPEMIRLSQQDMLTYGQLTKELNILKCFRKL